jgi:hypothetical protein
MVVRFVMVSILCDLYSIRLTPRSIDEQPNQNGQLKTPVRFQPVSEVYVDSCDARCMTELRQLIRVPP